MPRGRRSSRRIGAPGLALSLLAAACQTGHPGPEAPIGAASPPAPLCEVDLSCSLSPGWMLIVASDSTAITPPAVPLKAAPAGPEAEVAWIDAVLQQRAPQLSIRTRAAVAWQVAKASRRHGIDPLVVLSVIAHESRFDPDARGHRGGTGLMQLRRFVARDVARRHGLVWRGEQTLLDPAQNVAIGTAYLGEILRQFGDLELALAAYNMGPSRLRRMLGRGGAPRGQYLGRVLTHYADLSGLVAALETGGACARADC